MVPLVCRVRMLPPLLADAFHASLHLGCDVPHICMMRCPPHLHDAMSLHVGTHAMRPHPANCPARVSCGDLGEVLLHINRPVYDRRMGLSRSLLTYAPWALPMAHVWNKRLRVLPCRISSASPAVSLPCVSCRVCPAASNVCPKRASWRASTP